MEQKIFTANELKEDILQISGLMLDRDDANLIEFGLGSLHIMRLANKWRKAGSAVTFAKLISSPHLEQWLEMVNVARKAGKKKNKPGSATVIDPYQPYEMTDIQYSYWIGRKEHQVLGGKGCHAYLETVSDFIDEQRLNDSWKKLILHHPMLHTAFTQDGKQQLLKEYVPEDITVNDLRQMDLSEAEEKLLEIRNQLSHRVCDVLHGKNAGLALTIMPDGRYILHYDIDLLAADVQSFQRTLDDLATIYLGKELSAQAGQWNFAQYLADNDMSRSEEYREAEKFWTKKAEEMPGKPELPISVRPEDITDVRFSSRHRIISSRIWGDFKQAAEKRNITPAMGLLAVYAVVLERWGENSDFVLNLPLFNRNTGYQGAEDAIADFSNLLLLDVDLSQEKTFVAYAEDIQKNFHDRMKYSCYSGVDVVRKLSAARGGEHCPAPVVFACNLGSPILSKQVEACFGKYHYMISQTPQVFIDFQMFDYEDGAILLRWDSVDEIFPEGLVDRMFNAYLQYIERLAGDERQWDRIPVLEAADQENRALWQKYVIDGDIPERNLICGFLEHARRSPEKIALISSRTGQEISYGELLERSGRIAASLVSAGMDPQELVAVTLPKGNLQITAVLGVLLAGGCYVPVGVNQPLERQKKILKKAEVKWLLTDTEHLQEGFLEEVTCIDAEVAAKEAASIFSPCLSDPDSLAYIIFTSGSTGEPKGVAIQHKAAYNTIFDLNQRYGIDDSHSVLAVSALDFDLSVYDIFGMLNAGGKIVTLDDSARRDAEFWVEAVDRYGITVWNSVPALLDMLMVSATMNGYRLDSLKRVMLSGDWIGLDLPGRLDDLSSSAEIVAMGGATEASIWSNYFDVTLPLDRNWTSIPYGRPLTNQRYNVMDRKMRGCPEWVTGELVISGKGLAQEYYNDPEQTERHFYWDEQGTRWYRTGDLGRFRDGGLIEFLGRRDFQVKVRGHRIELGEIETALNNYPLAENNVVDTFRDQNGTNHLVAFMVMKKAQDAQEGREAQKDQIREHLTHQLPSYMIPELYVFCDGFPLTANGKVDRKQLLDFDLEQALVSAKELVGPSNETERKLLAIWEETLGLSEISCDDSFFELGGDSLMAVRLNNAIRENFQTEFFLKDIFETPVLSEQAAFILAHNTAKSGLDRPFNSFSHDDHDEENRYEPFPLTKVQKAYFMGEKILYDHGGISTHYYFEFRMDQLDIPRLEEAVNRVVDGQDMLHAVIHRDGTVQQVIRDHPRYKIETYDTKLLGAEQREQLILDVREKMAHKLFDSTVLPPFDLRVIEEQDSYRIHFCFNNIVFDGYSIFLFFHQITDCYKEKMDLQPTLPFTFRDYVQALDVVNRSPQYEKSRKYWTERLDTIPQAPDLPLAALEDTNGMKMTHFDHVVDRAQWQRLKEKLIELGEITPTGFLLSLYTEILNRWSKNSHFTINLTHFNRIKMNQHIDRIIGDFTSLTMLETDFSQQETFEERCRNLQQQLWKDLDHALYDGVDVERELAKKHGLSSPAFPYVFTSALGLNQLGSMFSQRLFSCSETPQVWIDHQVSEENGTLILSWDFLKERFPEGMMEEMLQTYIRTMERLMEEDGLWKKKSANIAQYQYSEEISGCNDTQSELPKHLLHSKIIDVYHRMPEKTAVIHGEKRYSYEDVVLMASSVSDQLRAIGASRGECIAVIMPKSVDQVYGVLGILGAGCVYVPFDDDHDSERKQMILKNAGIKIILTLSENQETYEGCKVLYLDQLAPAKTCTLDTAGDIHTPAYVIHTSGSTGVPKGVVITHAAAVNTIEDINTRFSIDERDTAIGLSQLYFDLSVYDLFGLLSVGGCLVYPEAQRYMDPSYWYELVHRHHVTIWNTVPAFMNMFVDYVSANHVEYPALRIVLLSGDWIPLDLFPKIKALRPDVRTISLGGATEASIWSIYYEFSRMEEGWNSIPYGKALANQQFYVLDENRQERPVMVEGELYIGGDGLASGYLNNEAETKARFIRDEETGKIYYRTGDLGRMMQDGNIEFLGRADTQVKILGFRIELGEIDSVMTKLEGVANSVTAVIEKKGSGKKLYSYVCADKGQDLEEEILKDALKSKLPKYMLPAKIVFGDTVPLTSNGKVDRKRITSILAQVAAQEDHQDRPVEMSETERKIAEVMKESLKLSRITPEDDFYDLGADSLIMGNAATKIRSEFHDLVPFYEILTTMLNEPDIQSVAAVIDEYLEDEGEESEEVSNG